MSGNSYLTSQMVKLLSGGEYDILNSYDAASFVVMLGIIIPVSFVLIDGIHLDLQLS